MISKVENQTKEKSNYLNRYIKFLYSYRIIILISLFIVLLVCGYYGIGVFSKLADDGLDNPNSESAFTDHLFEDEFVSPTPDIIVILEHPIWEVQSIEFQQAYFDLKSSVISKLPEIKSIISYFDYPSQNELISTNGRKTLMSFRLSDSSIYELKDFEYFFSNTSLICHFGGIYLIYNDIDTILDKELITIESISIPILLVILVFAYGSIIAATIPILLGIWTLVMTLASLHIATNFFSVTTYVTNVASVFGIGLSIDYSIFMHLRFYEEYHKLYQENNSMNSNEFIDINEFILIIEKMMKTSGRTILFSAILLLTCLLGALGFSEYYLTTLALTIIFVAFYASFGVLTFIPCYYFILNKNIFYGNSKDFINKLISSLSFLVINDNDINKVTIREPLLQEDKVEDKVEDNKEYELIEKEDIWFHSIYYIVKNPWKFLISISIILILLTIYFISKVKFATFSWAILPIDSKVRYAYESEMEDFASNGQSSMDIFIQIQQQVIKNPVFIYELDKFCNDLEALSFVIHVDSMVRIDPTISLEEYLVLYYDPYLPIYYNSTKLVVDPFFYTDFNHIVRVSLSTSISISDRQITNSVKMVRDLLYKSFKNPDGSSMIIQSGVTGDGPEQVDLLYDLDSKVPWFLSIIIIAMYIFIVLLTGSIFIPIKSILISGISISASFAILVFIFQEEYGSKLLQFHNNFHCLDELQLLFIFVVAFGISLDYEVFILGRIQELWENTKDNNYAIAKGISSSARVITLCALLILIAIGGFLFSKIIILKMIGIGIGLTIILDATIIRCILIPAIMSIIGPQIWYAPKSIKDIVKYIGVQEYQE